MLHPWILPLQCYSLADVDTLARMALSRATVIDSEGRDEIIVPPLPSEVEALKAWSFINKHKPPPVDPWAWLHERKTGLSDEMLEQKMGSISFVLDPQAHSSAGEELTLHNVPLSREVGLVASTVKVCFFFPPSFDWILLCLSCVPRRWHADDRLALSVFLFFFLASCTYGLVRLDDCQHAIGRLRSRSRRSHPTRHKPRDPSSKRPHLRQLALAGSRKERGWKSLRPFREVSQSGPLEHVPFLS